MINAAQQNLISQTICDYYDSQVSSIVALSEGNNVGGRIRAMNGILGEKICELAWTEVGKLYEQKRDLSFSIKKGEDDRILCTNSSGNSIGMQVDKHCYINGNLCLTMEAKSYLDRCYMIRASDDFRMIKKYSTDRPVAIIVALEKAVCSKAYDFILDEEHIDNVFFLLDGARTSAKPYWKKGFRKDINRDKLDKLITFISEIYENKTK